MTAPAVLGEPLHELNVRVIGIREFRADAHGPVGEIAGATEWLARRGQDQACHAVAFVGGPVVGAAPEPIEQLLACPAIGLLIADVGAELGIAVPGVELGRVVRQDLLPRDAGLLRPPHRCQDAGQVAGRAPMGIERDGHPERIGGPGEVPGVAQGPPQNREGLAAPGAARHGRPGVADRLPGAIPVEQVAELEIDPEIFGMTLLRLLQQRPRVLRQRAAVQGAGQAGQDDGRL